MANESAWKVVQVVYREQGLLAFWRGNLPNVYRVSGTAAINFTCMDYYKRVAVTSFFDQHIVQRRKTTYRQLQRRRNMATSFLAGGLAGATSTTVLYPFEFLRTRLAMDVSASDKRYYAGMNDVVRRIYHSDGIRGFFQGYGVALVGGIFYRILFLGGYEALKFEVLSRKVATQEVAQRYTGPSAGTKSTARSQVTTDMQKHHLHEQQLSWGQRIACAQTISLTAGTCSYPLDSVRRRMMMQAGKAVEKRIYRNSLHCIATVWNTEGLRGFYLGLGPNLIRSIGGALLLVGYDVIRAQLG